MPKHVSTSREGCYSIQTGRSILLCGFACMIMKCIMKPCVCMCVCACVCACVCVCVCVCVHVCVCGGGGAPEYVYSVGNTLPVWPKITFIFVVGNLVTFYHKTEYRLPSAVQNNNYY